jgi:hypothetical protein
MDEKLVEKRNKGRLAGVLSDAMQPYFDTEKKKTLQDLMGKFRLGKLDHIEMTSRVAVLCAIEDMENRLNQEINRGEKAAEELSNDDPARSS